jgi:hypothetical protein
MDLSETNFSNETIELLKINTSTSINEIKARQSRLNKISLIAKEVFFEENGLFQQMLDEIIRETLEIFVEEENSNLIKDMQTIFNIQQQFDDSFFNSINKF